MIMEMVCIVSVRKDMNRHKEALYRKLENDTANRKHHSILEVAIKLIIENRVQLAEYEQTHGIIQDYIAAISETAEQIQGNPFDATLLTKIAEYKDKATATNAELSGKLTTNLVAFDTIKYTTQPA